jgi:hypothetical protein
MTAAWDQAAILYVMSPAAAWSRKPPPRDWSTTDEGVDRSADAIIRAVRLRG